MSKVEGMSIIFFWGGGGNKQNIKGGDFWKKIGKRKGEGIGGIC